MFKSRITQKEWHKIRLNYSQEIKLNSYQRTLYLMMKQQYLTGRLKDQFRFETKERLYRCFFLEINSFATNNNYVFSLTDFYDTRSPKNLSTYHLIHYREAIDEKRNLG